LGFEVLEEDNSRQAVQYSSIAAFHFGLTSLFLHGHLSLGPVSQR